MPPGFILPLILVLLFLLPILFLDIMTEALGKLGIDPAWAPLLVMATFVGSLFNIPLWREKIDDPLLRHPLEIWRLQQRFPHLGRPVSERVIAMNVGGCVLPLLLVLHIIRHLQANQPSVLPALALAVGVNIAVCWLAARPVPRVGIMMPAFLPGAVAALSAIGLAPQEAPPVAFCAGVLGPVIGADLLHLHAFRRNQVGIASIGGAGTFDGIVLSGLLAVLLA